MLAATREPVRGVISLDAATVMLQWAVGGLFFCWVTTRHREAGLGYGWLLRGVYGLLAIMAAVLGIRYGGPGLRTVGAVAVAATAIGGARGLGRQRKGAGVSGQQAEHDRRSARVAAMTGIDRHVDDDDLDGATTRTRGPRVRSAARPAGPRHRRDRSGGRRLGIGLGRRRPTGCSAWPASSAGAAFLGAVTDAMLLGHWYLTQPGLPRRLLNEQVRWLGCVWPFEVVLLLVPTGMFSVFDGPHRRRLRRHARLVLDRLRHHHHRAGGRHRGPR